MVDDPNDPDEAYDLDDAPGGSDPDQASDDDGSDDSEGTDDSDDESEDDVEASDDSDDESDNEEEASDDSDDESDNEEEASDDSDDESDESEASDDDAEDDGDASGQQIGTTDLDQGTDLPTGDQHPLVIPYEDVEVELEWPSYIAERLPEDFSLTLTSPDLDDQTVTASGAEWTMEGAVRFVFSWRKKTRAVTLTASSGDQTVTLWDDQVVGDLGTMIDWETQLDPLLVVEDEDEPVDEDAEDGDTEGGDEEVEDDQSEADSDEAADMDDEFA